MKKLLLLACVLSFTTTQAQFDEAPWMKDLNNQARKSSNKPITFQERVNAFNAYWETRDPNVKGSGYKPFKRWEAYWENHLKEDGTVPNAKDLWNAYLEVENLKSKQLQQSNSDWKAVGPFSHTETGSWSPGQGRINVVVKDPNNPNTYYAGAPAGGIWKSTNGGSTWITTTDNLPQIGVSGIAIDPKNSNIIYIATGDDDASDSESVGVLKSTDGGLTWDTTDLNVNNSPSSMNDIYVNENNSQIVTVATNRGIFKSTSGGKDFRVANGTSGANMRDLKIKPGNPSVAYAVSASRFYKSTDGATSFSQVSNGLPTSGISRLVIDITPANPNVVYVLAADNRNAFKGIYKSTNSGNSFTQVASLQATGDIFQSTQSWYDLAFAVSDTNENTLYVGVLNVWKGTVNGNSSTFRRINNWNAPNQATYTHADIHYMRHFDGELLVGSDGGFYKSTNAGSSFKDLTAGMQIGQFYRIAVSKQASDKMVGGLQDNGGYALNQTQWQNYYGADGMDTAVDPKNSNLYYGFTQNGGSLNISNTAGRNLSGSVRSPESGNWITPLTMNSESQLYAGYTKLYRLNGNRFEGVSSEFNAKIDALEIDDSNPDNMYVAVNRVLSKSTNRGRSFSEVETFPRNITSVEVNNNNSNIIYVTTSNNVYRSTDGGNNFSSINTGLPNGISRNVIKHHESHPKNALYLGASIGVYRYDDDTRRWELFNNGLPNTQIRDLDINIIDQKITAATYGRGIWQSVLSEGLAPNDIQLVSLEGFNTTIACDTRITPEVVVRNNGLNTINEVELTYTVDGVDAVFNWNGTIASETNQTISLPELRFDRGLHTFKAVANITNDANATNNSSEDERILATDVGTVNVVNTLENESDALLVYDEEGTTQSWTRGVPTGTVLNDTANPSNKVYGTNLAGDHGNSIKSYLVSQCFDLTTISEPVLKFDLAFELEEDFDIVYVEYTLDEGATWKVLGSANDPNWYNSDTLPGTGTNCENCPGAQWTGTDPDLKEYSYNLSAFSAETKFQYRFVFHTDRRVVEEGAIIDNPIIASRTLSIDEFDANSFAVYPNPSKGIFNIKSSLSTFDYDVFDVTGKRILEQKQVNLENGAYKLDISSYASGVYFLNITTTNSKVTKKLILK